MAVFPAGVKTMVPSLRHPPPPRAQAELARRELDERGGQGVVVRLDQGGPADAEVDRWRAALAVVQALRPLERVEVLIDVDVAVGHGQPTQVPPRATRILAPIGAIDNNHDNCGFRIADCGLEW